jgi:mannose-6-phosphate isomerase-like protein (cupin superfamily)
MIQYYRRNIETLTIENNNYRKVLYTTPEMQLVVMSIKKGDEIHEEIHDKKSQFIRVESGKGYMKIWDKNLKNTKTIRLHDGICVIIPPNTKHYLKNSGEEDLKLYSIYSPPEHSINRIDRLNPEKND